MFVNLCVCVCVCVCILKCNLHVTLFYAQELKEKTKHFMKFNSYYCQYVRQPCVLK